MREFLRIVHAAVPEAAIRRAATAAACITTVALLGGCALPVPIPGMSLDDTPTGSIKPAAVSPFSAEMDGEDWRRAKSALDTALDPQGNGAKVAWDNPQSGAKGAFTPLAQPYPKDDGICRSFTASLEVQGRGPQLMKSSACRRNGGEWIVGKILPADAKPADAKPALRKAPAAEGENLAERDIPTHLN